MKVRKLTISILVLLLIIVLNSKSFAKYVFYYTKTAVILEFNKNSENNSNNSK